MAFSRIKTGVIRLIVATLALGLFSAPFQETTPYASAATQLTTPVLTPAASTTTSIQASWAAVPNRTSYLVVVSLLDGTFVESSSVTTTSAVMAGLSNSTSYKYTVTAIGDGVTYTNSGSAELTLATGPITLATPTITAVSTRVSGSSWYLTPTYTMSSTLGVASYTIRVYDSASVVVAQINTANGTTLTQDISVAPVSSVSATSTTGRGVILPSTAYRVTVTANGDGTNYITSAESTGVTQTTAPAVKFATPTAPTCAAYANYITVTSPTSPTYYAQTVQTRLFIKDQAGNLIQTIGPTGPSVAHNVTGLSPATVYQVQAQILGDGTFFTTSDSSVATTCPATSSLLNGIAITGTITPTVIGNTAGTSATVTWPSDPSGRGYFVRLYSSTDTTTAISTTSVAAGVYTATLNSLQPNTNYYLSVVPIYSSNISNPASEVFVAFNTNQNVAQKLATPVITSAAWSLGSASTGLAAYFTVAALSGTVGSLLVEIYDSSNVFLTSINMAYAGTGANFLNALDPTKQYKITVTAIGDGKVYSNSDPSSAYTLNAYANPFNLPNCSFVSGITASTLNAYSAAFTTSTTCSGNQTRILKIFASDTATEPLFTYANYTLGSLVYGLTPNTSYKVSITVQGDGLSYTTLPVTTSTAGVSNITTLASPPALTVSVPSATSITASSFIFNHIAVSTVSNGVASATASLYRGSVSPSNLVQSLQLTAASVTFTNLLPAETYTVVSRYVADGLQKIGTVESTTVVTTLASTTLVAPTPTLSLSASGATMNITSTAPAGSISQTLYICSDSLCNNIVQTIENFPLSGSQAIDGLALTTTYYARSKVFGDGITYLNSGLGTISAGTTLSAYTAPSIPSLVIPGGFAISPSAPVVSISCSYCNYTILRIYAADGRTLLYQLPNMPSSGNQMLAMLSPNTSYRISAIGVLNGLLSAESNLVYLTTAAVADPTQVGIPTLGLNAITSQSATITFGTGYISGSQYALQVIDTAGAVIQTYDIFATGNVVTGLKPGTTYTVRLYGLGNGTTVGSSTNYSSLTFTTYPSTGLVPPVLQASVPTATSFTLTIATPFSGAASVAAYIVKVYDSNGNLIRNIVNATSGLAITGLSPDSTYTVTAVAVGAAPLYSNSAESTPFSVTTMPQRRILAPQITVSTINATSVVFTTITTSANTLLAGYFVKILDQSCTTVVSSSFTTATSYTFSGLNPSTSYCLTAQAMGDGTNTLDSVQGGFTRFQTLPFTQAATGTPLITSIYPRSVTITPYGLNTAEALVRIYSSSDVLLWSVPNVSAAKQVTGLNPATTYKVSVTAYATPDRTTMGVEGPRLSFTTPDVLKLRAPTPSIVTSTLLPTSVALTYTVVAPAVATTTISYNVNIYKGNAVTPFTTIFNYVSGQVISGLETGTAYSVKMIAVGDQANYLTSDESPALTFTTQAVESILSPRANIQLVTSNSVSILTSSFQLGAWSGTNVLVKIYQNTGTTASPVQGRLITSIPNYTSGAVITGLTPSETYAATITLISNVTTSAPTVEGPLTGFNTLPVGSVDDVLPYYSGIYAERAIATWTPISGAPTSLVFLKLYAADGTTLITTITLPASTTTYTFTGLQASTTYRASLTFVGNGTGTVGQVEGLKSAFTTLPKMATIAPQGYISNVTPTTATVTYSPVVANNGGVSTRIRLYKVSDNSLILDVTQPVATVTYQFVGLQAGTAYKFTLTTIANDVNFNDSPESTPTTFTTLTVNRLEPPTFTGGTITATSFNVTATAVPGSISYIYRLYSTPGNLIQILNSSGTATFNGLTPSTTYYVTGQSIANGLNYSNSLESQYDTITTVSTSQLVGPSIVFTNASSVTATSAAFAWGTVMAPASAKLSIYDSATGVLLTSIFPYTFNSIVYGLTPNTNYLASLTVKGDGVSTLDSLEGPRLAFKTLSTMPLPPPSVTATQVTATSMTIAINTVNAATMSSSITNILKVYKSADKSPVTTLNISTPTAYPAFAISSAVNNGVTVTYKTAAVHSLVVGQFVTVTSTTVSNFNFSSYVIAIPTPTSFVLSGATTTAAGTTATGGTATTVNVAGRVTGLLPNTSYDVVVTAVANGSDYTTVTDGETITVKTVNQTTLVAPTPSITGVTSTSVAPTYISSQNILSVTLRIYSSSNVLLTTVPSYISNTVVSGLTPNTSYKLSLQAIGDGVNAADSLEGAKYSFSTPAVSQLLAPTPFLSTLAATYAAFNFTAPTGTAITIGKLYAADGTLIATIPSYTTAQFIQGLSPLTTYKFSLTSIANEANFSDSVESPLATFTTISPTTLLAPTPLLASKTATTAAFNFATVVGTSRYILSLYDSATGTLISTIPNFATGGTISGLSPNTAYKVSLTAIGNGSSVANSPEGLKVQFVTLPVAQLLAPSVSLTSGGIFPDMLNVAISAVAGASSYLVKIYASDSSTLVTSVLTTASQATITGLNPNTRYYFSATAISGSANFTTSNEGEKIELTTLPLLKLVSPRPAIAPASTTATSIQLAFTSPTGAVRNILRVYDSATTLITTIPSASTSQVISGLTPGTLYYLTLQSVASNGMYEDGAESVSIAVSTMGVNRLLAPVPAISNLTSDSLSFNFASVAGAASYLLKLYDSTGLNLIAAYPDYRSNTVISGLTSNTTYLASLTAISNGANYESSIEGKFVTATTLTAIRLNSPTPSLNSVNASYISVYFGNIVGATSYRLKVYNTSNTLLTTIENYIVSSQIQGLSPATAYKFTITAVGNGSSYLDSLESTQLLATTLPVSVLLAPIPNVSTITPSSVNVIFTPIIGSISTTAYVYTATNVLVTTLSAVTSGQTISGLSPATGYKIILRAIGDGANTQTSVNGPAANFTTLPSLVLNAPTPLISTLLPTAVTFTFTSVVGATSYMAFVYDESGTAITSIPNFASGSTISGLKSSTAYRVRIKAMGDGFAYADSNEGVPAAFTTLGANKLASVAPTPANVYTTSANFTIATPISGAISYILKIYDASGSSLITTIPNFTTGSSVTGLSPLTTYKATLTSVGDGANYLNSDESTFVSFTTIAQIQLTSPIVSINSYTAATAIISLSSTPNASAFQVSVYDSATNLVATQSSVSTAIKQQVIAAVGTPSGIIYTTAAPHNLMAGQSISLTGFTPAAFNAPVTVLSILSPTQFMVSTVNSLVATVNGFVARTNIWIGISGLKAGTAYSIRAQALGDGANFTDSDLGIGTKLTTLPSTVLLSPTPVMSSLSATAARFTYTAASGSIGTTLNLYTSTGTLVTSIANYVSGAAVTGLNPGTTYKVALQSVGDGLTYSTGVESAKITITTYASATLMAPLPQIYATTPSSLAISYSAAAGASSTTLKLYASDSTTLLTTVADYISGAVISGLKPRTTYYISLNVIGDGINYISSPDSIKVAMTTTDLSALLPATPVFAGSTPSSITLTYTPLPGVISYTAKIYAANGLNLITTVPNFVSGAAISGLTSATTYQVSLIAIGDGINNSSSSESSLISATTLNTPSLLAPTPTLVLATPSSVSFTYSTITGAQSYTLTVYGSDSSTVITTIPSYVSGASVTGLSSQSTYYATLTAIGDGANYTTSLQSPKVQVRTTAPPSLMAVTPTINTLLTSTASFAFTGTSSAVSYTAKLYSSSKTLIASISNYAANAAISGLTASTSYYLTLTAIGDGSNYLNSPESDYVAFRTLDAPTLLAPNPTIYTSTPTSISFDYLTVTGAISYTLKLYAADSSTLVTTVPNYNARALISGLSKTTTYFASIIAIGDGVNYLSSSESLKTQVRTPDISTLSAPLPSLSAATTTSLTFTYTPVAGASSYTLIVKLANGTTVATVLNYKIADVVSGLLPGTNYNITMISVGDGVNYNSSSVSETVAVSTTSTPTLLAPTAQIFKAGASSTTFSYLAVSGASSYNANIYSADGNTLLSVVPSTTGNFVVSGLSPNTSYRVSMVALGDGINAITSSEGAKVQFTTLASTTLLAPTLSVSLLNPGSISAAFQAVTGATGYTAHIYRSNGTTLVKNVTNYVSGTTISGLSPSTTYKMTVTALGDGKDYLTSAESVQSIFTTPALPTLLAPAPTLISALPTSLTIGYATVAGAVSYTLNLYSSDATLISTTPNFASGTAITNLSSETPYLVSIVAVGDNLNYLSSEESQKSRVSTIALPILLAPTPNLSGATASTLTISFSAISGATSYRLKVYAADGTTLRTTLNNFSSGSAITGLSANTQYYVSVTALGDEVSYSSSSEGSKISVSTTAVPTLLAPSPTVSATTSTSGTITFSSVTGASSYTLKVYQANGTTLVGSARTGFTSGGVITGLAAATTYKISITAIGDNTNYQSSSESAKTTLTTDPVATLLAPLASMSANDQTSVTLTFTAVSGASSYRVKLYDETGTTLLNTIDSFTSGSQITGLNTGANYKISITALGDGVNALSSSESTKVAVKTLPLATLVAPIPVLAGNSPTTLTFTYSTITGAASYTLKVYANDGTTLLQSMNNFASGDLVTGLSGDTAYKVGLVAVGDGVSYQTSSVSSLISASTAKPIQLIAPAISFSSVLQSTAVINFTPTLGALSYNLNVYSGAGVLLRTITGIEANSTVTNLVAHTTYKFGLIAVGNQSTYLTSAESSLTTITTANVAQLLEAPIDPPTSTATSITPYFEPVPGATGYSAKLYAADGTTLLRTILGIESGQEITGLLPNTVYKLTFISLGDGVNYLNSNESAADTIQTLMMTPTLSAASASSTTASATYTTVTGASSYLLRVYESDGYTVRRSISNYTSGASITGLIAGSSYGITITAIGNGTSYLDSLESDPVYITTPGAGQLAIPTVTLSATSSAITPTFASISGASSYSVKIYSSTGILIQTVNNVTSGQAISLTGNTRYGVAVAAVGDEISYFTSNYSTISYIKTVNQSTLSAPSFSVTSLAGTAKLTFTADSNAQMYLLKLYNSAGTVLINSIENYQSGTDVPSLNAGSTYKVSLTAIGDGLNYLSSSESTKTSFTTSVVTTLSVPVLTLARTNTTITPTFTTISGASNYTIKLYEADGTTLLSTNSNYVSGTPITGLSRGTTYKVSVIAIGDGFNYLNSAESSKGSITTTNPVDLTAPTLAMSARSPNSLTFTFTADVHASSTTLLIYTASGATLLRTITGYTTGTTITGLTPSTTYNFTTESIGDNVSYSTSAPGAMVPFTTAASILLTNPVVSFKDISQTSAVATFTPVVGAVSYQLNLYLADGTLIQSFTNVNPTGTSLTGLTTNVDYNVTITVVGDGVSYLSSSESGAYAFTTTAVPSLIATTPSVNPGTTTAVVTFISVDNASSYTLNLYRSGSLVRAIPNATSGMSISDLSAGTSYAIALVANGDEVSYLTSSESTKVTFTTNVQLAAPSFTLAKTSTSITASFSAVVGASGYSLKLFASDLTTVLQVITNYSSGTAITGLTPSTSYGVALSTRGNDSTVISSPYSSVTSTTTDASLIPVLATPSFTVTLGTTSVTLNYTRASGSDHYTAKLYSSSNAYIRSVNSSTSSATITGLTAGATYKVSLIAVGDGVNGLTSEESAKTTVNLPHQLGTPSTLSAYNAGDLTVSIPAVTYAISYTVKIYSATTSNLIRTITNYTSGTAITGLTAGESYNIKALAVGDESHYLSSPESSAELVRIPGVLSVPTFSLSSSGSSISVTFTASPSASSYTLRLYDSSGTTLEQTTNNYSSGTSITGLNAGTTFKVSLEAIGDGSTFMNSGESTKSTIATLTDLLTPVQSELIGDTWLELTYSPVAHASSYILDLMAPGGTLLRRFSSYTSGTRLTGLSANTAYEYSIQAVGDGTTYANSPASTGTFTTKQTLSLPTFTVVTDTATATINFTTVANALSYTLILYSASSTALQTITGATPGHIFTGLSQGTSYRVSIQALGDNTTYFNSAESSLRVFQLTSTNPIVTPVSLPAPVSTKESEKSKTVVAAINYVSTIISNFKSPTTKPVVEKPSTPITVQWLKNGQPVSTGSVAAIDWKPTLRTESGLYSAVVTVVSPEGVITERTETVYISVPKIEPKPLKITPELPATATAPVKLGVTGGTTLSETKYKVVSGACSIVDSQVVATKATRCVISAIQLATANTRLTRSKPVTIKFTAATKP